MQNVAGVTTARMKSRIRDAYSWLALKEPYAVPDDVLLYAPGALRIAISLLLVVGTVISIPYIIEHVADARLLSIRLLIIGLTALGAVLTFRYADKHYRTWVLLTSFVGISANLFFITLTDGPNINPHASILVIYVIGTGLCLGRRGVLISSVWLAINYLMLGLISSWSIWPHPTELSAERVQSENLSAIFVLMLILVPLLVGYMGKVERNVKSLRSLNAEQAQLLHRVFVTREAERTRIAHVLHEGAVQDIAALARAVRNGEDEKAVLQRLDNILAELRTLSSDLHPPGLNILGLPSALEQLAEQFEEAASIQIEVSAPEEEQLDPTVRIILFRIAQEALSNIQKHSRAQRAWLRLEQHTEELTLEVRDDGRGFDVEPMLHQAIRAGHFGLATLHELAQSIGGTLQIASDPRLGTKVTVNVPQRSLQLLNSPAK